MKIETINELLARAKLPALSRDQLLELAGTADGKMFAAQLERFQAGDVTVADDLEVFVRSLSPSVRECVQGLGIAFELPAFLIVARQEKRQLFAALYAIREKKTERFSAIRYVKSLFPQMSMQKSATRPERPEPAPPPYFSFKIFGKSAALCISEARTKKDNFHTIQVEGAGALGGPGPTLYDWPNKIIVQLTTQEAYQVLALFENKVRSLKFDGHGIRHDKSLHLEFQESNYFVRLIQKGKPALAVPVGPADAIRVVSLIYKQILLNEPHLDLNSVRSMVDRMVSMM